MSQSPTEDIKVSMDIKNAITNNKSAVNVPGGATDDLDVALRARVLRKLDWYLLPVVSLFYFLSFLDRANIANASIAGMTADLNLVGLRYNTAAAVFFVMYCLAQPASNIILKFFRPSRWIPLIMVVWGLIMTLMCLVKTYPQLLVARIFLGLAESGLFPGVTYYLSMWYPRDERAKRYALFLSAATVSGAFGGILAYGIEKMEGVGGLHGWQWIFCLEGICTVLVALASPFFMYDYPETATFLTEAERTYVIKLMRADSQGLATHYNSLFVLQALKDYKTYAQFFVYIGFVIPAYSIALFTPTIIHDLGFSAADAQLLSVPPSVAGCLSVVIVGILSDKHRARGPYVLGGGIVGLIGCLVLYTQVQPGVALFGVVLAAMGIFPCVPVILAWTSANAGGDVKRGVAIAMVNGLGNLGGICASFIFFDPPRYHVGLGLSMGVIGLSLLLTPLLMWDYYRINREKERMCTERRITDDQKNEFSETGDDSPLFRYTL